MNFIFGGMIVFKSKTVNRAVFCDNGVFLNLFTEFSDKQDCIHVCFRGVHDLGGVCSGGVCSWVGGVCSGVPGWGVSAPGGCLVWGGVCSWWGGGVLSKHALRQTPPCEQNHTRLSKYNLAPTLLRAVKICVIKIGHQSLSPLV